MNLRYLRYLTKESLFFARLKKNTDTLLTHRETQTLMVE